jgi:hypothetical protein
MKYVIASCRKLYPFLSIVIYEGYLESSLRWAGNKTSIEDS